MNNEIGDYIHTLRVQRDLTFHQLADASGWSWGYLSDIESGRRKPSLTALTDIARVFGMKPSDLLGGAEQGLTPEEWELIEAYRARNAKALLRMVLRQMDEERLTHIREKRWA